MQFAFDDDQALLQQSTRELLEKESPLAEARSLMEDSPEGFSKALHAQLGELGYHGMLLPEEDGGMGALAWAIVLAEMGRVAFPGPFLDASLAVRLLGDCGAAAWRDRGQSGEALIILAHAESTGAGAAVLETRCQAGHVRGCKVFVPFAAQADALLVSCVEGLALVARPDAGWNTTAMPTLDHAQRFAAVEFDTPGELIATGEAANAMLETASTLAALGASAILFGLMERSLEMTVSYTQERQAFNAPIASFQALQHRCADMLLQTESARSSAFRAAWATDHDPQQAVYLTRVAKAWAGPAARFVCGEAIQLHGGVGFTWEYDPHIYLKRANTLAELYGSTRDQLEAALQARGI